MRRKRVFDIIFVLCLIVFCILLIYLLKIGIAMGKIALCFPIPIILLGVRNMILSWIIDYPKLKPTLIYDMEEKTMRIILKLKNEGHDAAKSANVFCFTKDGGIEELECGMLAREAYVIDSEALVTCGIYPTNRPSFIHSGKDKKLLVKVETFDDNSKKKYCACRTFKKNLLHWDFDIKEDRNTKPYTFKFKPCKNCKFLEYENNINP
nr:hypothetical protein KDJLAEDB_00006 [Methanosarcinales archaeon ANME-1 ERB7]